MIDLIGKLLGLNWIADKLNGYKTYIGGSALILSGASGALAALAGLLSKLATVHDLAGLLDYAKSVPQTPEAAALAAGTAAIGAGLSAIGLRHAQDKAVAQLSNGNPPSAPSEPKPTT